MQVRRSMQQTATVEHEENQQLKWRKPEDVHTSPYARAGSASIRELVKTPQ